MTIDWMLAGSALLIAIVIARGVDRWRVKRAAEVMRKTYGEHWR